MEGLTYEAASQELESILAELKNEQVSMDQLASKVQRASELIVFCKEKLGQTQLQVTQIIEKLDL
ncbi:exodeoxyribonuclease VII small subunit [Myroides sp. LJL119]